MPRRCGHGRRRPGGGPRPSASDRWSRLTPLGGRASTVTRARAAPGRDGPVRAGSGVPCDSRSAAGGPRKRGGPSEGPPDEGLSRRGPGPRVYRNRASAFYPVRAPSRPAPRRPHVPIRRPPPRRRRRYRRRRHRRPPAGAPGPRRPGGAGRRRGRGPGPARRLPGRGGPGRRRVHLARRHAGRRTPRSRARRDAAVPAPGADGGGARGGSLGPVREAAVPVARRVRRHRGRRGGLRRVRVRGVPAPVRLRRRARPPADRRGGAGRPARRPLPDQLAPRRRLLRGALARPVGHRGRRADDGARHPPVRPAAAPARPLGGDPGDGLPPGPPDRERGRLHRPGALRERRPRHRRQQRPVTAGDQPHPGRLRRRDGRADPPVRPPQRRLDLHARPARRPRPRPRLAHPGGRRAQLARGTARRPPRRLGRGRQTPGQREEARATLEFAAALYKAAFTGRPVRAGEIRPGDPFHAVMHGDHPDWAPKERV